MNILYTKFPTNLKINLLCKQLTLIKVTEKHVNEVVNTYIDRIFEKKFQLSELDLISRLKEEKYKQNYDLDVLFLDIIEEWFKNICKDQTTKEFMIHKIHEDLLKFIYFSYSS